MTPTDALNTKVEEVRERIRRACQRAGRPVSSVTLIAVTKQVPVEAMREAVALGLTDLGENRVQEALEKQRALGSRLKAQGSSLKSTASSLQPVRWHLIGHLQRNKAKLAVEVFDVIHSVDSMELIQDLERHAGTRTQGSGLWAQSPERRLEVFIQVNVSGEATKFGCRSEEALGLARVILQCAHLRLGGLMTIAPFSEDPENARPVFRELRSVRDELSSSLAPHAPRPVPLQLSMGMSNDVEVAIEEGADLVRIGTAIFGTRNPG